jgi:hypothetical protein
LKQREIRTLRNAIINHKPRSIKTATTKEKLLTNSKNDSELEENIDLSIEKESDVTSEGGDNENDFEKQISNDV